MNEKRAINFTPAPIVLPPKGITKAPTAKLVRSQSAYARRVSTGTNWLVSTRCKLKKLNEHTSRLDARILRQLITTSWVPTTG
ncbi:hypothetical protein GQ600_4623 [Phytophthora cactorum]|nr:hypothetical protein GQ600_4623 [Phytophthora cactorum]